MHANTCSEDRFESFDNGLALLRRALSRGPEALNPLEKEGAIRRFEYCLELAWKIAKTVPRRLRITHRSGNTTRSNQAGCRGRRAGQQSGLDRDARPPHSPRLHLRRCRPGRSDRRPGRAIFPGDGRVARVPRCAGRHTGRISKESRKAGSVVIGGRDPGLFLEIAPSRSRTLAQLTNSDAGSIAGPKLEN